MQQATSYNLGWPTGIPRRPAECRPSLSGAAMNPHRFGFIDIRQLGTGRCLAAHFCPFDSRRLTYQIKTPDPKGSDVLMGSGTIRSYNRTRGQGLYGYGTRKNQQYQAC